MADIIDVIQCPLSLQMNDLPEIMSIGKPFIANGQHYILSEERVGELMACEGEEGNITTTPQKCHRYYVIKRIIPSDDS